MIAKRPQSDTLNFLTDPIKYNSSNKSNCRLNMLSGDPSFRYSYKYIEDFDQYPRPQASRNPTGLLRPKIHQIPNCLGQSRSESHLHYHSLSPVFHTSPMWGKKKLDFRSDGEHAGEDFLCGQRLSSNRVSLGNRTPSPRRLDDIKEEQGTNSFIENSSAYPLSPIKRSRSPVKQLFGEQGWLGRSTSMREPPSEEFRKTGIKHWGGKLKQRIEYITDEMYRKLHAPGNLSAQPDFSLVPNSPSNHLVTGHIVSLTPPEQAKLYSEIELMICATANHFLKYQQYRGRIAPTTLAKVAQSWISKSRPQVIEFRYDQQTQRDLVLYNIKAFRFHGPDADDPTVLNSMMHAWKHLGKDMSVRTFCTPDSLVRKHLCDINKVLEMLGAPEVMVQAYQEVESAARTLLNQRNKETEGDVAIKWGVERAWEPNPDDFVSDEKPNFL